MVVRRNIRHIAKPNLFFGDFVGVAFVLNVRLKRCFCGVCQRFVDDGRNVLGIANENGKFQLRLKDRPGAGCDIVGGCFRLCAISVKDFFGGIVLILRKNADLFQPETRLHVRVVKARFECRIVAVDRDFGDCERFQWVAEAGRRTDVLRISIADLDAREYDFIAGHCAQ